MSQPVKQDQANDLLRAEYVDDDVVLQWVNAMFGPHIAASTFNLDAWRDRYYAAREALERENGPSADEPKPCPACDPSVGFVCEAHGLHEYAFDLSLVCALRVHAKSHDDALRKLRATLDCAGANLGAWEDTGKPILAEVSLRGTPRLYETDDPTIPDAEKAVASVVFEPWTPELRQALVAASEAFDSEEDSVQAEHATLITTIDAVLEATNLQGISRETDLLAHLMLAFNEDSRGTHPDDDDYLTFNDWLLGEVLALPDGEPIKAWATEYLAIVQQKPKAA